MTTVSAAPSRMASTPGNRSWPVPAALIALGAIPVLAGSARLVELAGGSGLLPPRFDPSPMPGDVLYLFRLLAGSGMAVSLVLGYTATRRRDIARHMAWMTRAYALALGAGTQVFTLGIGEATFGASDRSIALLQGAGWVINLAVAEWIIRRRQTVRSTSGAVKSR